MDENNVLSTYLSHESSGS